MKLATRFTLVALLIGGAWAGKLAFCRHLESAGPLPAVPLGRPLAKLPLQLGDWIGRDEPIEERHKYGHDHIKRTYFHPRRGQALAVWMIYHQDGADRHHHPEVCMEAAGQPEDPQGRHPLLLDNNAPVQEFRFGRPGSMQTVFYWYYTLRAPDDRRLNGVQKMYQMMRQYHSSLTLQVFAPNNHEGDLDAAREFVKLLDAAAQPHLSSGAKRGSERKAITLDERG